MTAPLCASFHTLHAKDEEKREIRGSSSGGIMAGRAYAVLSAHEVEEEISPNRCGLTTTSQGTSRLPLRVVRVVDFWGLKSWRGDWSNDHALWSKYPDVREALHPDAWEEDGTFYMSWADFCVHFTSFCVCAPTASSPEWRRMFFNGKWKKGSIVGGPGGPPSDKFAWAQNPMIGFTLTTATNVGVVLSQRDERWENFARRQGRSASLFTCAVFPRRSGASTRCGGTKVVACSGKHALERHVASFGSLPRATTPSCPA